MGILVNPFLLFPPVGAAVPDWVLGGSSLTGTDLTADAFFGISFHGTHESGATVKEAPIPESATLKNYTCYVFSNTSATTADELRIYINGSDGNGAISIAVSTTGVFQDTTNSDSVVSTDDILWHFVEGTTATLKIKTAGFEVA